MSEVKNSTFTTTAKQAAKRVGAAEEIVAYVKIGEVQVPIKIVRKNLIEHFLGMVKLNENATVELTESADRTTLIF